MQQQTDASGDERDEWQRNGGFEPFAKPMIEVAPSERDAQHDREHARWRLRVDRKHREQRRDRGEDRDGGFPQRI